MGEQQSKAHPSSFTSPHHEYKTEVPEDTAGWYPGKAIHKISRKIKPGDPWYPGKAIQKIRARRQEAKKRIRKRRNSAINKEFVRKVVETMGFGLDIGGTLLKLVCFEPRDFDQNATEEISETESRERGSESSSDISDDNSPATRLTSPVHIGGHASASVPTLSTDLDSSAKKSKLPPFERQRAMSVPDGNQARTRFGSFHGKMELFLASVLAFSDFAEQDKRLSYDCVELGGTFHFLKLPSRQMEEFADLINKNSLTMNSMKTEPSSVTPTQDLNKPRSNRVGLTGGRAYRFELCVQQSYKKRIEAEKLFSPMRTDSGPVSPPVSPTDPSPLTSSLPPSTNSSTSSPTVETSSSPPIKIETLKYDELDCLVKGVNFLVPNVVGECYVWKESSNDREIGKEKEQEPGMLSKSPTNFHSGTEIPHLERAPISFDVENMYPYLLVNIGSGVSILKVTAENDYKRIGGSSLGGGTFSGLVSSLTNCSSFKEALELAGKGNSEKVDMLVGDIYGGDYKEFNLPKSTIASSFGKIRPNENWQLDSTGLIRSGSTSGSEELDPEKDPVPTSSPPPPPPPMTSSSKSTLPSSPMPSTYAKPLPEDYARAVLVMITNNIGSIANLHARYHNINKIIFAGNFLTGNIISMQALTSAVNFWSAGQTRAIFLTHEGYFGAVGALISSLAIDHTLRQTPRGIPLSPFKESDLPPCVLPETGPSPSSSPATSMEGEKLGQEQLSEETHSNRLPTIMESSGSVSSFSSSISSSTSASLPRPASNPKLSSSLISPTLSLQPPQKLDNSVQTSTTLRENRVEIKEEHFRDPSLTKESVFDFSLDEKEHKKKMDEPKRRESSASRPIPPRLKRNTQERHSRSLFNLNVKDQPTSPSRSLLTAALQTRRVVSSPIEDTSPDTNPPSPIVQTQDSKPVSRSSSVPSLVAMEQQYKPYSPTSLSKQHKPSFGFGRASDPILVPQQRQRTGSKSEMNRKNSSTSSTPVLSIPSSLTVDIKAYTPPPNSSPSMSTTTPTPTTPTPTKSKFFSSSPASSVPFSSKYHTLPL